MDQGAVFTFVDQSAGFYLCGSECRFLSLWIRVQVFIFVDQGFIDRCCLCAGTAPRPSTLGGAFAQDTRTLATV